jgi:hypothetical protein
MALMSVAGLSALLIALLILGGPERRGKILGTQMENRELPDKGL